LTSEQIDVLAFESVKFYLLKKFHARLDNWDKIMIIPERMLADMQDVTQGRVVALPTLQKQIVIKYCQNSLETFSNTYPYIS
jgi:hypothetical protein